MQQFCSTTAILLIILFLINEAKCLTWANDQNIASPSINLNAISKVNPSLHHLRSQFLTLGRKRGAKVLKEIRDVKFMADEPFINAVDLIGLQLY